MPVAIVKSVLDYKRKQLELERGEGAGLSVGELKRMLGDAVREANEPLAKRVEALEVEAFGEARFSEYEAGFDREELNDQIDDLADELLDDRPASRTLGRRARG
ncbi:MAG: hypothetical protein AAGI91_16195 [Bacteroidota bacterium]